MNFLKKKHLSIIITLSIILSLGFTRVSDRDFEIVKNLDIFYSLFRELNLFYVDDPNPEDLIETGIDAMLNSLDPYTTYISESEMDDFNFMTTGKYGGIGSIIRKSEEHVIIAEPYEGSPAARAGLRAGDKIISIDGFNTRGKELSEISERLKGTPGTDVELNIRKPGEDKNIRVKITREQIQINNVTYSGLLEEKTGYIRLSNFTLGAGNEVKESFLDLKEKGVDKLVLDLRGNPGGLLIEAVRVCNIFVDKGQLIVSTKGKVKQWDKDHYTNLDPIDTEIPLVVLVNRGSASASEIVAGAFQDLDRAVIIGQRTFGKGLVQTTRSLKYNTQLKVTTAKYYIPSGRCIQALDYSNRNEDGSVGHIPDSLISEYKTAGGRIVYDGGGIRPDIPDTMKSINQLALQLYAQGIVFDYATNYIIENPEKPEIEAFSISDQSYNDFIAYVKEKNFSYETQSEKTLKSLIETAKSEKYYQIAEKEFAQLSQKMKHDNETDLRRFKDEIIELINEEIISRYHFQAGRIKLSIETDPQVLTAVKVANDKDRMLKMLGKI